MFEQFKSHQTHDTLPSMISWVNNSGEPVPPFGCVQINSYSEVTGLYSIVKPTWEGALHYVNGPTTVLNGGIGTSEIWNYPRVASISPAPNKIGCDVGPVEGQWAMGPSGAGFQLLSNVSTPGNFGTVKRVSCRELAVRLDADLAEAEDATVGTGPVSATVYRFDYTTNAYVSLGVSIEVWNHSETASFEAGAFGSARWIDGHFWFDTPGSGGDSHFFWFTVTEFICPGDSYDFPLGGLIVTATISSTGKAPIYPLLSGSYYVRDILGILDFSIDSADFITGSAGRCAYGVPIGEAFENGFWILDSIRTNPDCGA